MRADVVSAGEGPAVLLQAGSRAFPGHSSLLPDHGAGRSCLDRAGRDQRGGRLRRGADRGGGGRRRGPPPPPGGAGGESAAPPPPARARLLPPASPSPGGPGRPTSSPPI